MVIQNCWKQAGTHSDLNQPYGNDNPIQLPDSDYVEYLKTGTALSIDSLLSAELLSYHSGQ